MTKLKKKKIAYIYLNYSQFFTDKSQNKYKLICENEKK